MPRILFLNNYPMVKARGLCEAGEFPSQHLWGMGEIGSHGFEVDYFPDQTWLGAPERLGYLVQQVQAAVRATRADLIYSACQNNVWLLARLRRLGLLRTPLVSMIHHPLRGWRQNGALVRGHDKLLFLSGLVESDVKRRFKPAPEATATVGWGPDLEFSDAIAPYGAAVDVLSAGKTNRDFATLVEALRGTPWSATVYCAAADAARVKDPPGNVTLYSDTTGHSLGYRELYQRSRLARVIAVPLSAVDALAGLTSVVDALALGKPLVMTKNRWLDFDPQEAGMGLTVEVGDVAGWRRAVQTILSDAELEQKMGQRARAVAQVMNTRTFAAELARHFEQVLNNSLQQPRIASPYRSA